jgi:hypothetical protein
VHRQARRLAGKDAQSSSARQPGSCVHNVTFMPCCIGFLRVVLVSRRCMHMQETMNKKQASNTAGGDAPCELGGLLGSARAVLLHEGFRHQLGIALSQRDTSPWSLFPSSILASHTLMHLSAAPLHPTLESSHPTLRLFYSPPYPHPPCVRACVRACMWVQGSRAGDDVEGGWQDPSASTSYLGSGKLMRMTQLGIWYLGSGSSPHPAPPPHPTTIC